MAPIVDLAIALEYLGLAPAGDPQESNVARLLDAISTEIRTMTRRAYEGAPTVYDEVVRIDGARFLALAHAPLESVIALRRGYFDGTEDPVFEPVVVAGGPSTTVAADAAAGATNLKVASVAGIGAGRKILVGLASMTSSEVFRVSVVGTAGAGGTGLTVEPAARYAHATGDAVVEVDGSESWRIDNALRGRLELRPVTGGWRRWDEGIVARYLRATYRVSGDVAANVIQACLEWLESRFEHGVSTEVESSDVPDDLASQSSDSWSESYFPAGQTSSRVDVLGPAPASVRRALAGAYRATGGGPI